MSAVAEPRPSLADRFRYFVPSFTAGGAALYACLARQAADQLERPDPNPLRDVLAQWDGEPPRRLLPLRLLGAVHRWVLAGELPSLAPYYRSAGGSRGPEGAWPEFQAAVLERAAELPGLLAAPHQHNEPSRAAALATGFLLVARETGLPLRLLEVGTSAGLLLRWDHYRRAWWFPTMFESPSPLFGTMGMCSPPLDGAVEVAERRGCDLFPIDPTTSEAEIRLKSLVWADLASHVQILAEAIEVCRRVPATIDRADGAEWLDEQLARRYPGVATVVFHALMRAASAPSSLERMADTLARAATAATPEAPLAYLCFEAPDSFIVSPEQMRGLVETRLTMWPGGVERLLATSDVNGRHVQWKL